MKLKLCYLAVFTSMLMLQSCGGGGLANDQKDTDTMRPEAGVEDTSARPRPPENAAVITTDAHYIYDVSKNPVLLRGINLEYGNNPTTRIDGITAIKTTDSNVVRLVIDENTTDIQLEAALSKALDAKLISIISFADSTGKLAGSEDGNYLLGIVDSLWLKKWAPVIAQDRFQSNIMINIADGWGPNDIFHAESLGYKGYIDTYKALIRRFRDAGWKVPIVIDAPHSGQDFNAFLNGRSRELMAADDAKNLVLGVHIEGTKWNSSEEISNAATLLYNEKLPFIATTFAGSGVADGDDIAVDQTDVLKKSAGDSALAFNLPWSTTSDAAAYSTTLETPLDLRSGAVLSTFVFLDKIYSEYIPNGLGNFVPSGKTGFAMYVRDINGNTLRAGTTVAKELRSNQWGKISFTLPASKADIDPANYLNGSTDIDLSQIQKVGVQVIANGKPENIKADVKFDDLTIFPGAPPATLAFKSNFDSDADGWSDAGWGGLTSVTVENGSLALSPSGSWGFAIESPGWKSQLNLPKIDFKQTVFVTLRMYIPASYTGENFAMNVWGRFGDWSIETKTDVDTSTWKLGEWNDINVTLKWSENADVSTPQNIGFQIGGFSSAKTEPILIDSITVMQQESQKMKTITALQYESRFTKTVETFAQNWNTKALVEQVDGELHITPEWKNDSGVETDDVVVLKADINNINEIDVSGPITYKVRIFVPASYAGSNLDFEVFTQDNNWGHDMQFPGRHLTIADFTPGAWTSFTFTPTDEDFPVGFARTQSLRHFGFRWKGVNFNKDVVKIDDIQLYGNKQVVDAMPILRVDFSTQAQYDAFKFDFASGAFTESALADAKFSEWKIIPFGWTATSWKGNTGDRAVLDISKAEDIVDLTLRGEEIVNGLFGIKNTSLPAAVSPLK